MCDDIDLKNFESRGLDQPKFDRRKFASLTAVTGIGATLTACSTASDGSAPTSAGGSLSSSDVTITTPDGTMDAFFVHPASGKHPAVIIWPDIAGLRPAFRMMAERLAASGYAVLVANPFYRNVKSPQFNDFADFQAKGGFQSTGPWRQPLTAEGIGSDAKALVAWLDQQSAVNRGRGVGTQGYCMGGPFTVWSAAAVPKRVKAAASFHGGGLVGDPATAPINLFDDAKKTHYLIAIAQNDDARAPDDKTKLRAAADAAGVNAEIEVYAGDHGWTVYDSPVYNEAAAEKAWARLLATYQKAL
jgi:carboxymethylenebutenolidase